MMAVGDETGGAVTTSGHASSVGISVDPPRRLLWLALVTVYVVWGSTYLAIRVAVRTIPPFLSAGPRFVLAGLIMAVAIGVRSGPRSLRVTKRELAGCALVGGLLLLGGNGLVVLAERRIDSGLAALVIAAVPLWVVLLRLVTGDRPRTATIGAVAVGFAGIAVLLTPGTGSTRIIGVLTALTASLLWSIGSFVSPRLQLPGNPFVTSVYEMLCGGAFMLVVAAARGEFGEFSLSAVSAKSAFAFGYLVVFGSIVAFTAYAWLLRSAPISLVATYAYVNPAVAVLLGALILGEPVGWQLFVGGGIVIASVAIVVSVEQRPRSVAADPAAGAPPSATDAGALSRD
jgi:drug/metabolite transporter (DMT)-like permease